jgi:hypothetical protein
MRDERYNKLRKKFPPSCPWGYSRSDLERYFGASEETPTHPLWKQLRGQTGSICDGRRYNHDTKEYEPSECNKNPYGFIAYTHDVLEWVEGEPVSDW